MPAPLRDKDIRIAPVSDTCNLVPDSNAYLLDWRREAKEEPRLRCGPNQVLCGWAVNTEDPAGAGSTYSCTGVAPNFNPLRPGLRFS